jgi:hypothetical protein
MNQFKQYLKQLLTESVSSVTWEDLWSGQKLKYGDIQKANNSPLRSVQTALIKRFPEYAKQKKMVATGYFGPKTATMIGMLWGQSYKTYDNVEIGIKTLEKLGFTNDTGTSSDINIIATTLVLEAGGEGAKGMQAVANVLQNRSEKRGTNPSAEAIRKKQFSMWNAYNDGTEDISDVIARAKIHPLWKTAVDYAKRIKSLPDVTRGATHYYNPNKVNPSWGAGSDTWKHHADIGHHKFGRDTTVSWART